MKENTVHDAQLSNLQSKSTNCSEQLSAKTPTESNKQAKPIQPLSASSQQVKFEVAWLNMHYLIQCHVKMLWTITPQDVFNLILEDTHSAFSGQSGGAPCSEPDETMVASRRESRQSYKHLMINLSMFRAVLTAVDAPYLLRVAQDEAQTTSKFAHIVPSKGDTRAKRYATGVLN